MGPNPNRPLSKLLELLDTQVLGVRSVGPVGDFLHISTLYHKQISAPLLVPRELAEDFEPHPVQLVRPRSNVAGVFFIFFHGSHIRLLRSLMFSPSVLTFPSREF